MEHALQVRILKELLEQIETGKNVDAGVQYKMRTDVYVCLLYTSPSPRDLSTSRMPSSA